MKKKNCRNISNTVRQESVFLSLIGVKVYLQSIIYDPSITKMPNRIKIMRKHGLLQQILNRKK